MLDQIRREIQDHLEELLGEIDKRRRALTALSTRSEPADGARAAASSAADQSAKTSGAATRTRKASVPPRPTAQPASPAAALARTRTAANGPWYWCPLLVPASANESAFSSAFGGVRPGGQLS